MALIFVSEGAEADTWEQMDDITDRGIEAYYYDEEDELGIFIGNYDQNDDIQSYDYSTDVWEVVGGLTDRDIIAFYYDSESDRGILFRDDYEILSYDTGDSYPTYVGEHSLSPNNVGGFFYDRESDRGIIFEDGTSDSYSDVFSYDFNNDDFEALDDLPSGFNYPVASVYDWESDRGIVVEQNTGGYDVWSCIQTVSGPKLQSINSGLSGICSIKGVGLTPMEETFIPLPMLALLVLGFILLISPVMGFLNSSIYSLVSRSLKKVSILPIISYVPSSRTITR